MDLETRIRKLANAVKYCKPDKCEGCKFIHQDSFARSCELMDGGFDSVIEYELANNKVAYNCPLLEKDSEEYKEILDQLEILVELKEARIKLQDLISREELKEHKFPIPLIGDYQQGWNDAIDAIFEYNGATIKTDKEA